MMNYLYFFLAAFVLEYLLVLFAKKVFPMWGLIDKPHKYGLKRPPIPYGGGILIFLVFFAFSIFFLEVDLKIAGILVASTILVIVSFLDDFYSLSPFLRLAIQFLVGGIVIMTGTYITVLTNPFGDAIDFSQYLLAGWPVVSIGLTLIWMLFVTNMVNWIDGINGLSSGVSFITFLAILFLSIRPDFHTIDQSTVLLMSAVLAGSVLAFWRFEFFPAKFLMGDSGTMFLGFMIAVLSIVSGGKLATAFLVLALPIIDGVWVILRRLYEKKSPFKGDLWHFHHRLLYLGLSERSVLGVYYLFTLLFGLTALLLGSIYKFFAILFLFLLISSIEIYLIFMRKS